MAEQSEWIIETTTARFEKDVVERSMELPVVVDFWAPWCEPCRQLAPLLEKQAREQNGGFLLAKVDIDAEQELAAAFRVQSIPYVIALRNAQPVNQFLGILGEEELQEWLKTILPSPADALVAQARKIENDDPPAAEQLFRQALEIEPDHATASIHLAAALLAQNRIEESGQILAELEKRGYLEPEAERIKSELDLRSAAADTGGVDDARKAAAAAPGDLSRQLKLADALAVAGGHEEALEICLGLVKQDKSGIGQEAKQTILRIFDLLGDGSDLAGVYRRKLATLLY